MPMVTFETTREGVTDAQCREWKSAAIDWTNRQDPAMVLVASGNHEGIDDAEYAAGYATLLKQMQGPGRKLFVMGDVPLLSEDPPRCLAAHPSSALKCATETSTALPRHEQQAALDGAHKAGAGYVDLTPWLCTAQLCPAIVGHYAVSNAPLASPENFRQVAARLAVERGWFLTDQFANPANPPPFTKQRLGRNCSPSAAAASAASPAASAPAAQLPEWGAP